MIYKILHYANITIDINIMATLVETQFMDEEFTLRQKFSEYYPGAEIDKMDPEILEEMMFGMLQTEVEKDPTLIEKKTPEKSPSKTEDKNWNKDIVKENVEMAEALIPEMAFTQSLIHLKGRINDVPITFMVDTGASMCVTHEYVVEKCCLHHLVDRKEIKYVTGAHSTEPTLGKIWCVEIDLEVLLDDGTTSFISIPVSIDVSHDVNTPSFTESEKMKKMKEAMMNILDKHPRSEEKKEDHDHHDHHEHCGLSHDVILGMTFLRSYRANIDFGSRVITLNGDIKLPFK